MKFKNLLVVALAVSCFGLVQCSRGTGTGSDVSLFKSWKFGGPVVPGSLDETITLSATEYVSHAKGMGLPPEGMKMSKKIINIRPNAQSKTGTIILGAANSANLFEAIHWYDLDGAKVRLYISGQQYDSAEEALQNSKGVEKHAKVYNLAE